MAHLTFDGAVYILDRFMQKKATHGTKSILECMQAICTKDFVSGIDQNDFANACANFDRYVKETGKTSMGRKQFEEWWDIQGTGEAGEYSEEALAELQEDELPNFEDKTDDDGTDWEPCRKAHRWNVHECPQCRIQELEAENRELKKRLEQIKELALWG
jgi:hypothetical protein